MRSSQAPVNLLNQQWTPILSVINNKVNAPIGCQRRTTSDDFEKFHYMILKPTAMTAIASAYQKLKDHCGTKLPRVHELMHSKQERTSFANLVAIQLRLSDFMTQGRYYALGMFKVYRRQEYRLIMKFRHLYPRNQVSSSSFPPVESTFTRPVSSSRPAPRSGGAVARHRDLNSSAFFANEHAAAQDYNQEV